MAPQIIFTFLHKLLGKGPESITTTSKNTGLINKKSLAKRAKEHIEKTYIPLV